MARGRMLSVVTGRDEKLSALSIGSLALYLMTIPHLDRDGLIDGRPSVLVGIAAPLRGEFMDDAHALIMEWVQVGVVTRYNGEREPVLWFHGFRNHQQGMRYDQEAPSYYPPPPGSMRCPLHGLIAIADGYDHEGCQARPTTRRGRGTWVARSTHVGGTTEVEVNHGGGGGSIHPSMADAGLGNSFAHARAREGNADADASPALLALEGPELRAVVVECWPRWGIKGWLGLASTLTSLPDDYVRMLLAWAYYWSEVASAEELDQVSNIGGLTRYRIDQGLWPAMSSTDRYMLERAVLEVVEPDDGDDV